MQGSTFLESTEVLYKHCLRQQVLDRGIHTH